MMPMNKRTFMAAIAIFALVFSLVGAQWVGFASANFVRPPEPTTQPPTVTIDILFPTNSTVYSSQNVILSYSVSILVWNDPYYGSIQPTRSVFCYLDGNLVKNNYEADFTSVTLKNLTSGLHNAQVFAYGRYSYGFGSVGMSDVSSVNFTIQGQISYQNENATATPQPIPTPTSTPTPITTPTHTPFPSPTTEPTPTPSLAISPSPPVPEFQTWIILPLATAVSVLLGYFCVRRRKP
jgi:hypothetical protein